MIGSGTSRSQRRVANEENIAPRRHGEYHRRQTLAGGYRAAGGRVVDHLTEEYQSAIRCKLRNAYAMREYADAKRALDSLLRAQMDLKSERRPQSRRRKGGDPRRPTASRSREAARDAAPHQSDRIDLRQG